MELAISVAAGFLFKTVDEIEDIDFIKSPTLKEYIRSLSIAVFSILFLDSTYISWFLAVSVIPISYYLKQVDTPFWKSLVPLPYLAIASLLHSQEIPSFLSLISTIILFGICAFAAVVEALFFPEEVSLVKLGTRIFLILIFAGIIYFLNPEPSVASILCLCIGYCLSSSVIKLLVMEPSEIIPTEEFEKFSESNIDEIIAQEIPALKKVIKEAVIVNKEVMRRALTFLVIAFHTLINKKSDESQLEIAVNFVKAQVIKVAEKLELDWLKEFVETFPEFYIPNLEVEKTRLLKGLKVDI
jgi:hypothetical protein